MVCGPQGHDVLLKPGGFYCLHYLTVHFSYQADAEVFPESGLRRHHFLQHFPQREGVAIGRKKTGVRYIEMAVGLGGGACEIFFVVAVGDHCHGRFCLGLKLLPNQRCAG